jgi:hypothetical protein
VKEPLTPLLRDPDLPAEDAWAAELVRANIAAPSFELDARERVRRRLQSGGTSRLRWQWRPAVAVGALALSSLAGAAVVHYQPVLRPLLAAFLRPKPPVAVVPKALPPVPVPPPPASSPKVDVEVEEPRAVSVPKSRHRDRPAPPLIEVDESRPPEGPPLQYSPVPTVSSVVRPEPSTPEIPAAPRPATGGRAAPEDRKTLSDDVSSFRGAMRALNVDRDGAAALRALDAYRDQFPTGAFQREAFGARIRALLMLGKKSDALAQLQSLSTDRLEGMPRGEELTTLRGELLQEAGKCYAALEAFERVLGRPQGALTERALWGRAGCRATLGDSEASRADLEEYLRAFPAGTFAARARAMLAAP